MFHLPNKCTHVHLYDEVRGQMYDCLDGPSVFVLSVLNGQLVLANLKISVC